MVAVTEDLKILVVEAVKEYGCNLYHLECKGSRLEIYIDKKGGASIHDCEKVSKLLSLRLRAASETYRDLMIDVSTPGIERRLYEPDHYRKAVGERVLLKLEEEVLEGRLAEAGESDVVVETRPGVSRRIAYNEVLSAQVQRSTEELFKRR
ncbi:hypothetical protein JXM67_04380 [candidate division WOR-3 bacterium]|nr:hypothetical protein [candidate division WOR-3 bacterium]